jgi:hypothetical protein
MQRRAAGVYVLVFLMFAAGAFAVLATAEGPTVSIDDPDYEVGQGDIFTVDGRQHTVTSMTAERESGGAHGGGGGGIARSATVVWTNDSARFTEEWTNDTALENASVTTGAGSATIAFPDPQTATYTAPSGVDVETVAVTVGTPNVTVNLSTGTTETFSPAADARVVNATLRPDNRTVTVEYYGPDVHNYDLLVPPGANATTVTLRQQLPPTIETVEVDGVTNLRIDLNGDGRQELVPIDEYDPLERVTVSESDAVDYRGNASTMAVADGTATLTWTAAATEEVTLEHEQNATLSGTQFLAYFPNNDTVLLTSDYGSYAQQVRTQERFHERENGLWGIVIMSSTAAMLLVGLALLPRKET